MVSRAIESAPPLTPTRTGRFSVSNRYFSIYARTTSRIRLFFYACQFRVDHDTTTVFANDHFLTQLDIQLFLGRNLVETTTAGTTLYIYDSQAVTCPLADTFESSQEARFDIRFQFLCFFAQFLFVLLGFGNDLFQFTLL